MDEQRTILLVEDDPFLSSLLRNRLQKENFIVLLAKDGDEAWKIMRTTMPDLILLDIILPKKPGFELMEELRNDPQYSNLPIIVISNLGQPEDVRKAQEMRVLEYFVKAKTSIDELVEKIKNFLQE
jgi:DNA-binding response OmpR family regulator